MDDIKKLLQNILKNDSSLQTLLGGSPSDSRVYPYYQGSATITETKPGFITYAQLSGSEEAGRVENPVFSITIWARTWPRSEDIRDRVTALLHKKLYVTAAPESRKVYFKKIHENDQFQEHSNFTGKALHFRIGVEAPGISLTQALSLSVNETLSVSEG